MIRQATADDLPALRAFLRPRAATSLFLSCGLKKMGDTTSITYWIAVYGKDIHAVFGRSQQGFLLCEAPDFDPLRATDLRRALSGQTFTGLSGEARQIATLRSVLGLDHSATTYDKIEPLFHLNLDDLILPPGPTQLRDMVRTDRPLVRDWRFAFDREIYGDSDTPESRQQSAQRVERIIHSGSGQLLEQNGTPVAMTSFNATFADIVQVGSVYTPPALRGQGHARRAVALQLTKARASGITTAILYSLSDTASRTYQSIGFTRIGDYAVIDFARPAPIGDPA